TVHVAAGTYVGMNLFGKSGGTSSAPISFLADPGVKVTTVSSEGTNASLADINVESTGWYVIEGFDVESDGSAQRAGIRVASSSNTQVLNNTVNKAFIGVFVSGSDNVLVQGNTCSYSTDQHGIYVSDDTQNCVIRSNTLFGNNWDGLHMNALNGQPNNGALVEDNVIYGNGLSGMDLEGVTNATYRNNIIYNNTKHGITLHNQDQANTPPATGNVFENNTIVANGMFGVQMQSGGNTANTFFNNIFLQTGSMTYGSIGINGSATGLVSDYNVVVNSFSTDVGNTQITLAQWQSTTAQDKHSIIATASQLFVNPAGNDFHLKSTSPAVDAGIGALGGASAPTTDFDANSRPQGSGYDIGAYELVQATSPPTAPSGLGAVPQDPYSIQLSWTDNAANQSAVLLERSTDGTNFSQIASLAGTANNYTDTGLTTGTRYYYRVRASNSAGTWSYSNVTNAVVPAAPAPPAAPSGLSATAPAYGQINLSWTDNSTNESAFLIERSTDGTNFSQVASVAANATSYSDTGLSPSTLYYYRVRATNNGSNSG